MRRLPLLLVAALAALAAIPSIALADPPADGDPGGDPCPAPEITHQYDAARFTVHATLLASGCPTREHRHITLSAFITRHDASTAEGHGRNVSCGPFRSASDMEPGEPRHTYSCDIEIAMDHPSTEAAQYQVEVTYPGADGEETMAFESFWQSNADGTSCDEAYHPAEPAAASPGARSSPSSVQDTAPVVGITTRWTNIPLAPDPEPDPHAVSNACSHAESDRSTATWKRQRLPREKVSPTSAEGMRTALPLRQRQGAQLS